jgi:DNA (cytosine-5)-methyltransferase 1
MKFSAVDLFAGCGGLSEGFHHGGFDIVAQLEMDSWACETLRTRHLYHGLKARKEGALYNQYIKGKISRDDVFKIYPDLEIDIDHRVIMGKFGADSFDHLVLRIEQNMEYHGATGINVLLGGPPCQPYSVIGRSRDPDRMQNDKRHYLYRHYLDLIEHFCPDVFVYENVPGLFTAKANGEDVFQKILKDFYSLNPPYEITPPLMEISMNPHGYILNCADFRIPQARKRLILIGYRQELKMYNPRIKRIFRNLQHKGEVNRKRGRMTVRDAIGDLPLLKPGEGCDGFLGRYQSRTKVPYQKMMRRGSVGVLNHKARPHMGSDLARYRFFIELSMEGNGNGNLLDLMRLRPDLTPKHTHIDKFFDRFKVQRWEYPSSTITAHLSQDGHYFIHPDIGQCRSLTVREAARIQSFPDNFKFEGPRTQQFRQVGNAVPPLLAAIIAKTVRIELSRLYRQR